MKLWASALTIQAMAIAGAGFDRKFAKQRLLCCVCEHNIAVQHELAVPGWPMH